MIKLKSIDIRKTPVNALIILASEDKPLYTDRTVTTLITKARQLPEFKGAEGDRIVFYEHAGINARRLILLGTGKTASITVAKLRKLAGKAVRAAMDNDLKKIEILLPTRAKLPVTPEETSQALTEGACLANHRYDAYKKDKKHPPLKEIVLIAPADKTAALRRIARDVQTICRATLTARNWVNQPANDQSPALLARAIKAQAASRPLTVQIMSEKTIRQHTMGGIEAVAAGSQNKPRLVIMHYTPPKAKCKVALVGKGVTFDTGGLNLKTSGSIKGMQMDMAGAAAVAAAMTAAADLKLPLHLTAALPLVENMISGNATRPGDIITMHDGQTVEIGNTDAEGRLILADAMAYTARKHKPDIIIDMATLTGACMVALGENIAGVFSPDDPLTEAILAAGEATGESCWRMPLPEDYQKLLKSNLADISNISSSRWGGAITAALFLQNFVDGPRWAHIDIAGPAHTAKAQAFCPAGGTGFGVRLLIDLLRRLAA